MVKHLPISFNGCFLYNINVHFVFSLCRTTPASALSPHTPSSLRPASTSSCATSRITLTTTATAPKSHYLMHTHQRSVDLLLQQHPPPPPPSAQGVKTDSCTLGWTGSPRLYLKKFTSLRKLCHGSCQSGLFVFLILLLLAYI